MVKERPERARAGSRVSVQEKVCGFWRLYTRSGLVSDSAVEGDVILARSRIAVARVSTGSHDSV